MTNRTCAVDDCGSITVGLGLCSKHWQRFHKYGTTDLHVPTIEERFWAKVNKTDTCWIWTGHRKPDGYGRWRVPNGEGNGKSEYVHRIAWQWANGDVPEGMQLDHRCHNTSCVRPDHLRLTTSKQNQEHRIRANAGNVSGVRGVTRSGNRWVARVRHEGKTYYVGSYATIPEAGAAVKAKRLELFTHNDADRKAA
jgi:hypothetical protein